MPRWSVMKNKKALTLSAIQDLLLQIPYGKVTTYGEMARALGSPRAARAVGTLCGKNPEPDRCPCFKVVRSTGEIGEFALGTPDKIKRLKAEGIPISGKKIPDLGKYMYRFS